MVLLLLLSLNVFLRRVLAHEAHVCGPQVVIIELLLLLLLLSWPLSLVLSLRVVFHLAEHLRVLDLGIVLLWHLWILLHWLGLRLELEVWLLDVEVRLWWRGHSFSHHLPLTLGV